ncbi:LysR family transcriptional regulator [Staphylococcus felis]|uniref:LysR family transcriptional regulator n=1 Tax=Staphylococcus felis TaxID=46127 RepID=A0AAQ0KPQ0_9STAP|nr:LysR family transcriptional regulator [Staphylococcus felis]AVP36262.1 LysR family transcriptional regulator [Staphylococcus felis]MBH9580757.1 LysR family transcriptional regulator [Staphylococcus felis]MDM8327972.1 LysR family transcriptional regulator [Staphylococcus felis]MDQ7193743.1 LysR family transcriptional regulator [Staphylococcus felis]PNZ34396.1 LysR family transcriptional regulator [Staphylococcus felis]
MDIKQMTYFVEIVKQGGMTRAAEALYIAQPTISKAIKELEHELGNALFDRSKRQLTLTDVGEVFYEKSLEILNLYGNLPNEISSVLGVEQGHITIGLSAIMDMERFSRVLGTFHQKYPSVTFNLIENGGKTIETQIRKGDINIGVTSLPVDNMQFDSFPLYSEKFQVVAHSSHPLAQQQTVEISALKDEDFILFNEDFYLNDKIIAAARKVGFVPNIVSKISQWHFIEHLLSAKMGISILPENIVNIISQNQNISVLQLSDAELQWEMGVIWKKDVYLNHATQTFLDYLNIHH